MFWEYTLESEVLCLGERIKKGTFRPTLKRAIPSTQITGALRYRLGRDDIWAIGYLDERSYRVDHLVLSLRDLASDVAKLPLTVEVVIGACGSVFLEGGDDGRPPFEELDLTLGALISKGLGRSKLALKGPVELRIEEGGLRSRLPESEGSKIGLQQVIKPLYGYLFQPSRNPSGVYTNSGIYARALIEGSLVRAYNFILRKEVG